MLPKLAWLLIWIYIISTWLFCRCLVFLSLFCLSSFVFFSLASFLILFFIFNFTEKTRLIHVVQRLHRLEMVYKTLVLLSEFIVFLCVSCMYYMWFRSISPANFYIQETPPGFYHWLNSTWTFQCFLIVSGLLCWLSISNTTKTGLSVVGLTYFFTLFWKLWQRAVDWHKWFSGG